MGKKKSTETDSKPEKKVGEPFGVIKNFETPEAGQPRDFPPPVQLKEEVRVTLRKIPRKRT